MSTKHLPETGQSSQPEGIQSNLQPSNGHTTAAKHLTPGHAAPPPTDYAALLTQLARQERDLQILAHRLAARETELAEIKASRGWRWLGHFWYLRNEIILPALRPFLRLLGKTPQTVPNAATDPALLLPEKQTSTNLLPGVTSKPNAFDVICFPIIEWDFRFQRPQQLMTQFAAAGHRVFYLSHKFCGLDTPYQIEEKAINIYEVTLGGTQLSVYRDQLDAYQQSQLFFSLDTLRRDLSLGATVSVVQLPFWWPMAEQARATFGWPIVYDCMDHHAGFSTNTEEMLEQEHKLFSASDLVVVSSTALAEEAKSFGADPLMIRNACEYEHFAKTGSAQNKRPVIGYYGAIADWFDSDLVADLAVRRPDWDFVLVGSTNLADITRLSKLPNVNLSGEQPYATLPRWLTQFDVTLIPFKRMPLTEATNPVKAYEILAAGKPLVSVPLPEVVALGSVVRLASNAEEFEREIEAALKENSPELIRQRRAFAKDHTWQKRFELLSPAIAQTFPKASIIIVTYYNRELNRMCLEKLYERTEWPNFEVVVLDNASADGTPDYLKEAEKSFPNIRVVLNDENLGFAKANNIGLRMATGDYLVLLNNDTVITRGWLTALLRHLHTDSELGLVGPVTNAIANEARIEVGYEQIQDMPAWAADYVRQHDGETFAIPMLAMFCVAMRRKLFEEIGLLDEQFGIGMFEDDDYCRRITVAGHKLACARDSFIHHWQRASFKLLSDEEYLRIYRENQRKFEEKWRHLTQDLAMEKHRQQLQEVLDRVQQSRGVVIFLPSIGWRVHLFQRPHHLARTFARQGYLTIFDSSGSQDGVNGFEEIEHNVFLFNGAEELLHEIPEPILWTFPYNYDRADKFPGSARKVYDWIDDLAVFPYDREFLERNHERALREASIVASVAAPLHQQALKVRRDAIYLPNGVEFEAFAKSDVTPTGSHADPEFDALLRARKPIAGYYGALASWFDYDLLDAVAERRPDWNFVLIGQALDNSLGEHSLLNRENVTWLGARDYATLPTYLQHFEVATIPFAINEITLATSPLKLYEYLAGGKPVIATPMPECQAFPEVFIARNAEEFSRLLDKASARGRDTEFRQRLQTLAHENSWTARVRVIERALGQASPKFSSSKPAKIAVESCDKVIAELFSHFRTSTNEHFFAALTRHFSGIPNDPCLPMYFEFAITCNERGRKVANLLRQQTGLAGKRYLDVGCAYGGFLVAFAEQGAQVTGFDLDSRLLALGQYNLRDHNLDAPLQLLDATNSELLRPLHESFDVVTCNDVIEHVDDPKALVRNIAHILAEGGLAYFEIPNALTPRFVLSDGHYQLFGITLLDYPEAREYFSARNPGVYYGVRHYLKLDEYRTLFAEHGLSVSLLEEIFTDTSVEVILKDAAELRESVTAKLEEVPEPWRERIRIAVNNYLKTLTCAPLETEQQSQEFLANYGPSFWRLIVRKVSSANGSVTVY
ncbi:MAG: glycosyltransferase [Acidobacteria bacterium]|nr:glycosyltransferase [Acidobacteriota bacterium]